MYLRPSVMAAAREQQTLKHLAEHIDKRDRTESLRISRLRYVFDQQVYSSLILGERHLS